MLITVSSATTVLIVNEPKVTNMANSTVFVRENGDNSRVRIVVNELER